MGLLESNRAIVTGAGTGLGAATAIAFAGEGAAVTVVGRRAAKLEETADVSRGLGADVTVVPGDVAIDSTASEAVAASGGVDILVNNAGLRTTPYAIHELPVDVWDSYVAINLRGPFLFTRAPAPSMMERGGGSIVNVASSFALVGFMYGAAYSAAKAGVVALTRSTAVEYGSRGIRANCLCPGAMAPVDDFHRDEREYAMLRDAMALRGRVPLSRVADVREVAELILFLAGPDSQSMTRSVIPFDGGFTAK